MDYQNVAGVISRKKVISSNMNSSSIDKIKPKKKKRKRRSKEGKRSSASSASFTGSPDSTERLEHKVSATKTELNNENKTSNEINESLRWPKYNCNIIHSSEKLRTEIGGLGRFPEENETGEEYENRINFYKMNRRKRYLAAQQKIINNNPVFNNKGYEDNRRLSSNAGIAIASLTLLQNSFSKSSISTGQEQNNNEENDTTYKSKLNHLVPIIRQGSITSVSSHSNEMLTKPMPQTQFDIAVSISSQNRIQEVM